jgi:DNA-binding CsgD family transcriptional regulator
MKLLERDQDLARLEAAFAAAQDGHGRIVLVSGEAGIGKTSFVGCFARGHEGRAKVLTGYCDPLSTPSPLGPIHDVAGRLAPGLPALLARTPGTALISAEILLAVETSDVPFVLIIEDIHWADDPTLDLIKSLGRRLESRSLLLVLTFRDDQVRQHHGLRALLGHFANLKSILRIPLRLLSRQAVAELASGARLDVDALFRKTSGNPFFISEAILNPRDDVPVAIRDAVLARAELLDEGGRALLELVAVIGTRADEQMLSQFSAVLDLGLAGCLSAGMLRDSDRGLAFRHELARSAILDDIDPVRRRALYRDVLAAAVRAGGAARGQHALLAHYAEATGDLDDIVAFGLEAAKSASRLGAHREAAAHYDSVLRASGGLPAAERAEIAAAAAREFALVDRLADAARAYDEAIRIWSECGDRLKQGEALAALAWPLVRNGLNEDADRAAADAIALLEPHGPTRQLATAYRTLAHLRMLDRDRLGAEEIGGKAIALAAALGDPATLAASEMVVGSARLVSGDFGGLDHLNRCQAIARAHGLDEIIALSHLNAGSSYGELYLFDRADQELETGLAFAREHDLDHSSHYMQAWLALTRLYRGRWTEAADRATAVLDQPNVSTISRIMALVALGRVRTRRGDPGGGEALDEALALAQRTGTLQRIAPVRAARAEHAWFEGDRQRVLNEAGACLDLAIRHRHPWHTGELLFWRSKAGHASDACEAVAKPFGLQMSGEWAQAASEWRSLGCPFEEARALAEGDEPAQIRALEIYDDLGASPAAAGLRRRMHTAGVRRIPRGRRTSTRQNRFGLTPREQATLDHLAAGLSNAQIADRLFISRKTVDHHVSAILGKLCAGSRSEAVAIAAAQGSLMQNGERHTQKWEAVSDATRSGSGHAPRAGMTSGLEKKSDDPLSR